MISDEDFNAIVKVFHVAIKSMVDKEHYYERVAIIEEWQQFMSKVDVCMAQMVQEKKREIREGILKEFEQRLRDCGYDV